MADIVAFAGIPEEASVVVTPFTLKSGIGTFIGPDEKVTLDVVDVELVNLTAGSPRHMVTGDGVTTGAGGV